MTPAYKHLESKTRIGELTIGQWGGVFGGVMCAIAIALWIRPLPGYLDFALAVYIGGLPAGAVFLASISEFDFGLLIRSAIRWYRTDMRYRPGPGECATGYAVSRPPGWPGDSSSDRALDLVSLWERSEAAR
jgi:hypothetical protein